MKVFVTGATGIIGEELCLGLRRAGHEVYGLVRNPEKAHVLSQNEVNIVVGNVLDKASYISVAKQCEVLVHAACDYNNYQQVDSAAISGLLEASVDDHGSGTKKLFIYTSGILVYPPCVNGKPWNENDPPMTSGFLVADRVVNERAILKRTDIYGVVVRPAFVFGKKSRHFVNFFHDALIENKITVQNPYISWSQIHIDDLVEFYVRLIDTPHSVVASQVFNIADQSRNTNLQIAKKFAQIAAFKGEIELDEKNVSEFRSKTVVVDNTKAMMYVGWKPRHKLMLDEADIHFNSWKAREGKHLHALGKDKEKIKVEKQN